MVNSPAGPLIVVITDAGGDVGYSEICSDCSVCYPQLESTAEIESGQPRQAPLDAAKL